MIISELAKNIQSSPTLAITAKAKQLKKDGQDIVGFGAGEPDFDTPEFIKQAAIDAITKGDTKYTPVTGTLALKHAITEKLHNENNLSYTPEQIIVNCGAKHTLFNLIMCLTGPGDEVIIPSPYWVSYPEMVKASGATPVIANCLSNNSLKLTPEILQEHITDNTKLLILNSPSNPTGILYTLTELEAIGKTAISNGLLVISDEIYEHLVYNEQFYSIAQVSENIKEKTIIVNGVSKAYSMTGWRIGYAAGQPEIISACGRLQSHSTSNPTSFAQAGAVEALTSTKSSDAIAAMVIEFKKRRDFLYNELVSIPKVTVTKPKGAFYIFPFIGEYFNGSINSSFTFAEILLNEKLVALVPGEGFGAPGYVRLSYATSMEDITKGIERIKDFLSKL